MIRPLHYKMKRAKLYYAIDKAELAFLCPFSPFIQCNSYEQTIRAQSPCICLAINSIAERNGLDNSVKVEKGEVVCVLVWQHGHNIISI